MLVAKNAHLVRYLWRAAVPVDDVSEGVHDADGEEEVPGQEHGGLQQEQGGQRGQEGEGDVRGDQAPAVPENKQQDTNKGYRC